MVFLDYNAKFDRRSPPLSLAISEIQELVGSHLTAADIQSVSLLAGGFINTNYRLILRDDSSLVLRVSTKSADFQKELRVLRHVHGTVPVPKVIAEDFSKEFPFALIEFVNGALLSDRLFSLSREESKEVAFEIGLALSRIHTFDFGKAGFFDANFSFDPEFRSFGNSMYEYIRSQVLSGRVRKRLGTALAARLLRFMEGKKPVYQSISNGTRLIHSDYNLKNILVRKAGSAWKVAAILDWEFAFAGSPLVDIGNFLRFENELPQGFAESFIQGYGGNRLPSNWREIARLLDLAAMVNFLDNEGEAPRTFSTAISVIRRTLETLEGEVWTKRSDE
jgi:aminoglycoside phosphotransferase (APT) family kinase protein